MSDDNWNELVPWYEAFDKANNEEKNYIRLLLSNKEKLNEDARDKNIYDSCCKRW